MAEPGTMATEADRRRRRRPGTGLPGCVVRTAMKPSNGAPTFETWTEQYPDQSAMAGCRRRLATASATKRRLLHGNVPAQPRRQGQGEPPATMASNANLMSTPVGGYPPPGNVPATAQFCRRCTSIRLSATSVVQTSSPP